MCFYSPVSELWSCCAGNTSTVSGSCWTPPAITAVTGIRRAGKSVLLRQFAAALRDERQVVYVDKESFAFESLRTARDLIDHVESATRPGEPRVVIVDEVQQIADWERAVASLNGEDRTEVVISGSNATLLSAELATLIAGRYVTLQVFPLTLAEFGDLYRQRPGAAADDAELFRLYLRIGGLPGLLHTDLSDTVVEQMLADIVSTIAIRDVIRRHRIRDVALFEAITRFAVDSVGSLVSAKRIADFLKSQRRRRGRYRAQLSRAPGRRVPADGRSALRSARPKAVAGESEVLPGRHRPAQRDHRLPRERHRRHPGEPGLPGIAPPRLHGDGRRSRIARDRLRRGRRSRRLYVQVAYLLESSATIERELAAFAAVRDAYPRVLLSLDPYQPADLQGVRHQSLTDFLRGAPLEASAGDEG